MYHHYHIPKKELPAAANPLGKMAVTRSSSCMNCGRCVDACIYNVHERSKIDPRVMAEPNSHLCKNCLKCVETCPQRALTVRISPEYQALGGGIWTPVRVSTIWNEAQTGKLPVFGAGYRGMFAGPGYDSMWTDMSEIVRPTRDGIHGREYISTTVDLGARVDHLEFDPSGKLLTTMPKTVEVPLPILMDVCRISNLGPMALEGLIRAASSLETILFFPAETKLPTVTGKTVRFMAPVFSPGRTEVPTIASPRMVGFEYSPSWSEDLASLRSRFPDSIIAARITVSKNIEETAISLVSGGVDILHLLYDEQGQEMETGRTAKDSLLSINKALAQRSLRESVSILAAGGLVAAEHVPKSIICGADAVVLEQALKVALGCHACPTCKSCLTTNGGIETDFAYWRVTNMIGAWRDQLLEVMGAMGIREARRLRGEIGRAIFYEDAERDAFANLLGGA